jgi:hypothetical protein
VSLAISSAIYRGVAAATAHARADGYTQVSGAHLIAAFLDDPGSLVARAAPASATAAAIRAALVADAPSPDAWPGGPAPVALAPEVGEAVVHAEHDQPASTTGHVLLRLLARTDTPTSGLLRRIGIDSAEMVARLTELIDDGERDIPTPD